ncbi:MAG: alpha/beta hydrolase [Chloroflexota bacterium]|nr:alpha/beta hydrolase [Chloroflexota bacterium]
MADRVRAGGIDQAFRRWTGPPEGRFPPVVILHGVLQAGEGMHYLAEVLSGWSDVIVPDLRGRGDTEQPEDGYDPATMAADVASLLGELGVGPAVVIGRKHGGVVAYHLAATRADLVAGLVLGDTSPEISEARAQRVRERMATLPRVFGSLQEAERFYEAGMGLPIDRARNDIPIDLESLEDGTLRWRHNLDLVARIEDACMPRSDWELLGQVTCPILVLRGHRGEITPEIAARLAETPPGARVQVVHGSRHDVFIGPGSEQSLAAIALMLREATAR